MFRIKQLLKSGLCLECRECCRFYLEEWKPHLLEEEKKRLGIPEVKLRRGKGVFYCQFLNEPDNKCRIYPCRPFECALYPFILLRRRGTPALAAHIACPSLRNVLEEKETREYIACLCRYLKSPRILSLLKKQHRVFPAYPEAELVILETDLLSGPAK